MPVLCDGAEQVEGWRTVQVSVAMATWQGERFLPEQLASLLDQTRLPDEMVVIDDASTDGTREVLEAFRAIAPFPVVIVTTPNRQGSTPAFARAIAAATGDIIALADQDDIWLPHKLAHLEAIFERDPATTFAFSDATLIDDAGEATEATMWQVRRFTPELQERVRAHPFTEIAHRFLATGCTIAFRRELRSVLLPFPTGFSSTIDPMVHDRWLSIVLSGAGRVAVVDEPLVAYRIHVDQQIGLNSISVALPLFQRYLRRLRAPRTDTDSPRVYQLTHLVEARSRLISKGLVGGAALEEIDAVIAHQSRRCHPAPSRIRRVAPIAAELIRGNYHRYSRGWSSALIDLTERAPRSRRERHDLVRRDDPPLEEPAEPRIEPPRRSTSCSAPH